MNINQSVSLIMFAKYIQYIYYAIYKKKMLKRLSFLSKLSKLFQIVILKQGHTLQGQSSIAMCYILFKQ